MEQPQLFEIRIPKDLLHDHTPDIENLDFKFWITVRYWFGEGNELRMEIQCLFDLIPFIKWESPKLKQYLTAACENQYENLHAGGITNEINKELLN